MIPMIEHLPPECPGCGRPIGSASQGCAGAQVKPGPSVVVMCQGCGWLGFFDDDLKIQKCGPEEIDLIAASPYGLDVAVAQLEVLKKHLPPEKWATLLADIESAGGVPESVIQQLLGGP